MLDIEMGTNVEMLIGFCEKGGKFVIGEGAIGVVVLLVESPGCFSGCLCHLIFLNQRY